MQNSEVQQKLDENNFSMRDTVKHIRRVGELLIQFSNALGNRAVNHDASKLESPEWDVFSYATARLRTLTYGTPEYEKSRQEIMPALEEHYKKNSHHPEFYQNGIDDMNLVDLVEMICDWKAATERHDDGNLKTSIESNMFRFKMSPQLVSILLNTARHFSWIK